jgi:CelD/BcsL family acetyltransferase involved in cellulose biosynthesis
VLIKHLLEDALARGVDEFDFTIGDEAFKYHFANRVRRTEIIRVFRRAHLYHLDRVLLATRARIMRSPQLARWARQALRLLTIPPGDRRPRREGP